MGSHDTQLSKHIRPIPTQLLEGNAYYASQGYGVPQVGSDSSEIFQDYIRVASKYRWLIAIVSFLTIFFTLIYSLLATPMYDAEAILKIGTYAPLLPGASIEDSLQQQTREIDYMNTQVRELQSLPLADRVLSDEPLGKQIVDYLDRQSGVLGVFEPFIRLAFHSKDSSVEELKPRETSYSFPVGKLQKYLNMIYVTPVRKTSLVKVTVTASDPALAASIANSHTASFIDFVRDTRQKHTLENLVFLKTQAEELAEKVAVAERNLAAYAEENAIVSVNKDENIVVRRMSELNQLLTDATAKRIKAETLYKEAESGSGLNSTAFDDPSIQSMRVALKEAESEYAMLSRKFTPSYPKMVQLKAKVDALKENLSEQRQQAVRGLKAEFEASHESEKTLQEQLEIQKSKAFELSRREVQFNIMKREYDSLRDLHQAILRQLKEAQISSESSGSNITIAEPAAIPTTASSPRIKINLLVALCIGPLLGIGLAIVLESLDNTLKNPEDVQRSLNLPTLGIIPIFTLDDDHPASRSPVSRYSLLDSQSKDADERTATGNDSTPDVGLVPTATFPNLPEGAERQLIAATSPRSVTSEAFRTVRTALLLSSADNPPKVVLVTSGKKSEGKTTLVSNLAITLAQMGSKTLLIDADLRRPAVHKTFSIDESNPGLVELLTHQKPLDAVINTTSIENLFIIPVGSTPPNPAELIGSKTMAALIDQLAKEYDYVLIDTPPVLPVTDAVMLSRAVDGVLLVVRGQDTHRRIARDAASRLEAVGAKILGVVLNDVDLKSGDYHYYYKETYSYYYGEDEERSPRRRKRSFA